MHKKPIFPIELELLEENTGHENDAILMTIYCKEMIKMRKTLYEKADMNINIAQHCQKRDYDKRCLKNVITM